VSNSSYLFLEPVDVLFLRGNKGYGDPGSYGESYVPPWPSVIAGALRSRILADDGCDLAAFARGDRVHPELGTPVEPGPFRVTAFHLARRFADGRIELLVAPPADLVVAKDEESLVIRAMRLVEVGKVAPKLKSSYPLPLCPVLAQPRPAKPVRGYWLTEEGWRQYLAGKVPDASHLVRSRELWDLEPRVGVGLDPGTRSASEGRLFTAQAVIFRKRDPSSRNGADFDAGFLVGVAGAKPPRQGMLRIGGDGRAMTICDAPEYRLPEPDYGAIAQAGRCRLVLASPGIFPDGWLPTGVEEDAGSFVFDLHGVRGRLVAACVPRAEIISGWDLAQERPKPARRAAPAGSVYWLDELEAREEDLRRLVAEGLWSANWLDAQRRAEGFNRIGLAAWSQ